MAKIKDLPKFRRPREKLAELGVDALKDYELLAVLLRTGYKGKSALELAKWLLKKYSLAQLESMSFKDLARIKGIGKGKASIIKAAFALAKRLKEEDSEITVSTPADAVKIFSFIREKKREYFVAAYLNARNILLDSQVISIGTLESSLVHPREVLQPALVKKASGLIVCHNHPSGSLEPSQEDLSITQRLKKACEIMGIELLDHIIISFKGYLSFKQKGLL